MGTIVVGHKCRVGKIVGHAQVSGGHNSRVGPSVDVGTKFRWAKL